MSARTYPSDGSGVAVALASSFFGFYTHCAFMAALYEGGIQPEQIAGTSSGALTATLCGMGLRGQALTDFVMQPGLRRSFADAGALLRFPGVMTNFYSSGILSGDNAVRFLRKQMQGARLEQFDSPKVQIAVTNLTRKESVMIQEGDAAEWVVASCAIPGLFCHRTVNGEKWCDGGVALHIPFEHWLQDPTIHTIILHNIDHFPGKPPLWPTLCAGYAACHETISKETTKLREQLARLHGKRLINVRTETARPSLFPHQCRTALFDAGRASGLKAAQMLREAIAA